MDSGVLLADPKASLEAVSRKNLKGASSESKSYMNSNQAINPLMVLTNNVSMHSGLQPVSSKMFTTDFDTLKQMVRSQ
jgi:hypothetical protein